MKRIVEESGQTLVLGALMGVLLLGSMAMALDVGLLFNARRRLQTAADAAATAGAQAYLNYNYDAAAPGDTIQQWVSAAAKAAAAQDGVTDGSGGTMVTASTPPSDGVHTSAGYVAVLVSQPTPTIFMGPFSRLIGGKNFNTVNVTTRAVAGSPSVSQGCIFVLSTTACPAMTLQGSFTVTANRCGVVVDSPCSTALNFTGSGGSLTAGWVGVAGGVGGASGDSTPTPVTGIVPVTNPLQGVTPPNPSSLTCSAPSGGTLTGIVSAGTNPVCYSGNVTISNATLSGTFVFTGNVTLSGTINTGGSGVTIDLNSGGLTETTGTTMNIVAPTSSSSPYMGIVLMAPSSNTSTMEFDKGAAGGTFTGIIDTPGANLYLHDSGGDRSGGLTINSDVIVATLDDQTATFTVNSYSATNQSTTPLRSVALVE
ncbi:MAG TPA: pilus assembly protein TadG-related protein [Terracidiphilus sp.]|jgi:Flp pilus assembly protein TadG